MTDRNPSDPSDIADVPAALAATRQSLFVPGMYDQSAPAVNVPSAAVPLATVVIVARSIWNQRSEPSVENSQKCPLSSTSPANQSRFTSKFGRARVRSSARMRISRARLWHWFSW